MPRCAYCKKKTHLEFTCKCSSEKVFCATCRMSEVHGCAIVYKPVELIKIVPVKMEKI